MKNLNKIIENLFYAFIFLLPWQTTYIIRESFLGGEKWQYGTISFYFIDLLLILIFGLYIWKVRKEKTIQKPIINKSKAKITLAITIFTLFAGISFLWSPDKELAIYNFIKLSSAVGLFFVILNININWKKLFFIILLSALIQSSFGLWQFFNQEIYANKYLGLSHYKPQNLGVSVIETTDRRWMRAYGSFTHPNIFGGYLAISLLYIIYFSIKKKIYNYKSLLIDSLLLITITLIFAGLIVSFSRSSWLAFIVGLIIIVLTTIIKKQKNRTLNLAKIIFILIIIALLFYTLVPEIFQTRLDSEKRLESKSITERMEYGKEAQYLIKNNFITGVGLGNYTLANYQKINKNLPAWNFQPVHNIFLLIFSELGIIGFVLFIYFLFSIGYKNLIAIKKSTLLDATLFATFIALLILMLFDHYLWTSHFGLLFLLTTLGFLVKDK